MELYYVMSIIERKRAEEMTAIFEELGLSIFLENLGNGTATSEHLLLYDLEQTEKAVFSAVATRETVKKLFLYAEEKMYIDIPGNGIMLSIPLKSVAGAATLSRITEGQEMKQGGKPSMEFEYELIVAVISEGYSDDVMAAAREAGAGGGTVIHAKGTLPEEVRRFMRVSIAQNKDMLYILSPAEKKAEIMRSISEKCGKGHPAEAIAFSLPVSAVCGIRKIDEDIFE